MDARLAVWRLPRRSGRSDVVGAIDAPGGRTRDRNPAARASAPSGRGTGGLRSAPPGQGAPVRYPRDDGRGGHRETWFPPATDPAGPADDAASISASLEGPRAALGAVGGGTRR